MPTKQQIEDNAKIKGLNDVSKRLAFCRKVLGLTLREVANGTGLSHSTCFNRENGTRSASIEEYELFARFYNVKWMEKFSLSQSSPSWNSVPIKQITVQWIVWGNQEGDIETANQELRARILELEGELRKMRSFLVLGE